MHVTLYLTILKCSTILNGDTRIIHRVSSTMFEQRYFERKCLEYSGRIITWLERVYLFDALRSLISFLYKQLQSASDMCSALLLLLSKVTCAVSDLVKKLNIEYGGDQLTSSSLYKPLILSFPTGSQ